MTPPTIRSIAAVCTHLRLHPRSPDALHTHERLYTLNRGSAHSQRLYKFTRDERLHTLTRGSTHSEEALNTNQRLDMLTRDATCSLETRGSTRSRESRGSICSLETRGLTCSLETRGSTCSLETRGSTRSRETRGSTHSPEGLHAYQSVYTLIRGSTRSPEGRHTHQSVYAFARWCALVGARGCAHSLESVCTRHGLCILTCGCMYSSLNHN